MMYDDLVKRLRAETIVPYATLKMIRDAADAIEELQKQRKTGKWIYKSLSFVGVYICSNCGESNYTERTKYCPNCGARMAMTDGN